MERGFGCYGFNIDKLPGVSRTDELFCRCNGFDLDMISIRVLSDDNLPAFFARGSIIKSACEYGRSAVRPGHACVSIMGCEVPVLMAKLARIWTEGSL